ncbi:MAG: exo-alpha-sialidase [Armatimonadetes bacterium]|nr:exo-alpha-sialidase [Armatimonadota bacterium]
MLSPTAAFAALALTACLLCAAAPASAASPRLHVAIVAARGAPEVERWAAGELRTYVERLFGAQAEIAHAVPSDAHEVLLLGREAGIRRQALPELGEQDCLLQRVTLGERPALLIDGGSPAARAWAAFELAQRWGVRPLLHGDALPQAAASRGRSPVEASGLRPGEECLLKCTLPIRQWRVVNDFAMGPESWGMADYRPVLDQLAKLKFNRILVNLYPNQPFLHLECEGVKQQSAHLWYDYHYPITDDMVGRRLCGDGPEFWNPDLPLGAPYEEFAAAGERLVHALMAHAKARGMQVVVSATLMEYPPEFAPLLPGAQKVHQLGEMTIVPGPGTDPGSPEVTRLAAAVLRTTVNTYPEADRVALGMPEFRQWADGYERAWATLDRKYRVSEVRTLDDVLAQAQARTDYPGGAERAVQEVKGDIVALRFYDRLLTELHVLQDTARPDMRFVFVAVAEELFPILPRVLPPGSETLNQIDYTPSRILARRQMLRTLPARELPSALVFTLHDDNVGVLPQLTTGSLHELTRDLRECGWAGFSTRYWLIGDHDPCIAYLSRAATDADAAPEAVYRDQMKAVCGEACVEDMLIVFRIVESVTVGLEAHGLGLTFPVPGMMMKHWAPGPLPPELVQDREQYREALAAAQRAKGKVKGKQGREYVDYWLGRLQFGVGYLDTIEQVRAAATAEAAGNREETVRCAQAAAETARRALEAYAGVARDRSDLGALATMNEYVWRPLRDKAAALAAGTEGKHVEALGMKEHPILVGDGKGGWKAKPGELQFLHQPGTTHLMPFGLVQMDNGEVLFLASAEAAASGSTPRSFIPVTAISSDAGDTWSALTPVPDCPQGRPMMLTDLGKGELCFQIAGGATSSVLRLYSHDYGRTWPERVPLQAAEGQAWNVEGNALVDRDAEGKAIRIAEIGYKSYSSGVWPAAFEGWLRWSGDGGRTWTDETKPAAWYITMEWQGKEYLRGVSEGSLTRARNGDLVAALRVDMPPRYYVGGQSGADFDDSLEGLGISISEDDGKTWSPINLIYEAGRHHAHLLTLPNGDIVMTYIVRVDVRDGKLASYRRGCEALISHDNGRTWRPDRRYILDEFEYYDGDKWFHGETGHLASTCLTDGRILTVYGHYRAGGSCLIRWRP